ncbi:hypothetical protein TRICI_006338 [Trichomonascus ciferrii]|uniref:rRNA-processing protein EFG1 n=1 Tax=Trichomonascus ciferrii TaxID=44093 RepID=A0A642UI59_9ASCO|nr:hypothetical protein TRICI_006338 [Trichomonascus ciferrii]
MGANKKKTNLRQIEGLSGKSVGSAKLKKKIRDLERLLKRPNLEANKKVETERALAALRSEVEGVQESKKVGQIAKKYHMVRFFERKKAYRRLKQALKRHLEDPESKSCKKAFEKAEVDLYYTLTFPIDHKYVSLFPTEAADKSADQRKQYRKQVEAAIKQGKYPVGLDEDSNSRAMAEFSKNHKFQTNTPKKHSHSDDKKPDPESDSDNNDDDFFE